MSPWFLGWRWSRGSALGPPEGLLPPGLPAGRLLLHPHPGAAFLRPKRGAADRLLPKGLRPIPAASGHASGGGEWPGPAVWSLQPRGRGCTAWTSPRSGPGAEAQGGGGWLGLNGPKNRMSPGHLPSADQAGRGTVMQETLTGASLLSCWCSWPCLGWASISCATSAWGWTRSWPFPR